MERRTGIADMFRALPIAHQVMIGIAGAVLAMAAFLFYQWVSVPSFTVLYSGLDDQALSTVVEELDRQGIPYQLDGEPQAPVTRLRLEHRPEAIRVVVPAT